MLIRTLYGSKSLGGFLLYDLGDEKAPVCEIWCFYHNPNTLVDFWTLAPLLTGRRKTHWTLSQIMTKSTMLLFQNENSY